MHLIYYINSGAININLKTPDPCKANELLITEILTTLGVIHTLRGGGLIKSELCYVYALGVARLHVHCACALYGTTGDTQTFSQFRRKGKINALHCAL